MTEAVVHRLEVVEVDEHDRDQRAARERSTERVGDAVGEQSAVREVGDWIVERLMCELVFERLALADVTAVEHDPLDVLVVQQLRVAVPRTAASDRRGAAVSNRRCATPAPTRHRR